MLRDATLTSRSSWPEGSAGRIKTAMSSTRILEVAVVLLIFNRPEPTRRVFEQIRAARPARLLVVADGPRPGHASDAERCAAARAVTEGVDWTCQVERNYASTNLGCGRRVASGLDWAFGRETEAIILEDDCVPDVTFFPYCAELLARYRDDPRVGMVSGSNHQDGAVGIETSYFFCRYGNIWGWATWRRAWEKFDLGMSEWPRWRDGGNVERLFPRREVAAFWRRVWDETAAGKYDTWDFAWTFCYLRHGMLGILPRVSLIENVGFGSDASHTAGETRLATRAAAMTFPLRHPATVAPDLAAEDRASRRYFSEPPRWRRFLSRVRSIWRR
jgi:hypothetical protein